ncbi:MAG: hypothetical protein AABY13_00865 [Nanoarchaeota archaeon]
MFRSRKGVFFTIDAIIALSVLAVGVLVLFLAFGGEPARQQTALYAGDLMTFFSGTRLQDVRQEWATNLWCTEGPGCTAPTKNITQPDQTLLAIMAQLVHDDKRELASYIAFEASKGIVQPQFGFNLSMTLPDASVALLTHRGILTEQSQQIAAKSLVYFVSENHTLEGPYVAQVLVWQ